MENVTAKTLILDVHGTYQRFLGFYGLDSFYLSGANQFYLIWLSHAFLICEVYPLFLFLFNVWLSNWQLIALFLLNVWLVLIKWISKTDWFYFCWRQILRIRYMRFDRHCIHWLRLRLFMLAFLIFFINYCEGYTGILQLFTNTIHLTIFEGTKQSLEVFSLFIYFKWSETSFERVFGCAHLWLFFILLICFSASNLWKSLLYLF